MRITHFAYRLLISILRYQDLHLALQLLYQRISLK